MNKLSKTFHYVNGVTWLTMAVVAMIFGLYSLIHLAVGPAVFAIFISIALYVYGLFRLKRGRAIVIPKASIVSAIEAEEILFQWKLDDHEWEQFLLHERKLIGREILIKTIFLFVGFGVLSLIFFNNIVLLIGIMLLISFPMFWYYAERKRVNLFFGGEALVVVKPSGFVLNGNPVFFRDFHKWPEKAEIIELPVPAVLFIEFKKFHKGEWVPFMEIRVPIPQGKMEEARSVLEIIRSKRRKSGKA